MTGRAVIIENTAGVQVRLSDTSGRAGTKIRINMTGETTSKYTSVAQNVDTFAEAAEVDITGTGSSLAGPVDLNGGVGLEGGEIEGK